MVQNNKVLTVSYGTFSCTLEGFDDSFETMKSIAEYFRDLAADDRYFGSEPPQPDAEMLTRIAQRDATRKVEASQNENGLLLRAQDRAASPSLSTAPMTPPSTPSAPAYTAAPSQSAPIAEAEPVEGRPEPAADSIAAKLQRIRAVVSHSEENSVIYAEDEDSPLMKSETGPTDAVSAAFQAGTLTPTDLAESPAADAEVEAAQEFEPEPQMDMPPPAAEEAEIEGPAQETPAVPEIDVTPTADDVTTVEAEEVLISDLSAETDEAESDEIDNILTEDISADADEPEEVAGYLTEEDEETLLDEIASVEAVLSARASEPLPEEPNLDEDVSRLMEKAVEQMDDPATATQRETYSRLRNAVAATNADRADALNRNQAQQISPRRPESNVTTARPKAEPAAPLKLVAEQRIDNKDEDEMGPISPRRVKSKPLGLPIEESGFAHYAQEQGAQSLPDLLEAAASYLSFIEGQEQFSRPQLMNKIRSLKQDDFNREESLRSFGQLLRDGKIEKAGGGRFAASDEIGFRPDGDERAAG